jgi:hypothetical protein
LLNETSVLGHIFPDGKVENDEIDVLFVSMVIVLKEESLFPHILVMVRQIS